MENMVNMEKMENMEMFSGLPTERMRHASINQMTQKSPEDF